MNFAGLLVAAVLVKSFTSLGLDLIPCYPEPEKGIKEGDRFDPKSIRYSRKYKSVYDLPRDPHHAQKD